jgi:Tol biopolymer transport system component
LLLISIISVSSLNAQYFGRNKVEYKSFKFRVMKTEHFDVYFYPEGQEAAKIGARMAERWYARLSRIFNHQLRGRQPLILYANSPDFQQTTAIPDLIGEGTGGVTEITKRRIILPLGASLADSDHVIGHELVHAFQFDLTSQEAPRYASEAPAALRLPLWFIEGQAEYLSIGPVDANTSMWMRDITRRDKIPPIKKLENPEYFPYRYGQALWAYITGRWGDAAVAKIMKAVSRTGDYKMVFKRILGVSEETLSKDWQKALKEAYTPLSSMTQLHAEHSRPLVVGSLMNMYNVSPSISPNGKDIVYLSTRDLFSIDLYLGDAQTGRIKRKLTNTALNPHFESLQFIKSSGCWSADGKQFVFGAINKGKPILTMMNMEKGDIEREVSFPQLGEILSPTWSPDGRFVAFSALVGGLTDIFIYDLQTGNLKRMTDDPFADLYPSWAPDGHSIAFSTERFSTDLSLLNIGTLDLALMNPETGEIQKVPAFSEAKNINPQWSADSKSLYFLSDQNGISDIYRIDLENQKIYEVTNIYTGVSGITESSPAISVSQENGQLAYTLYDEDKFSIYIIDSAQALAGEELISKLGEVNPSILPPRKKQEGEVLGLLKNPLFGLPKETEFRVSDYKPTMKLDYISQPQVAIGADRFGTYGGGGIALSFSDMLGYHNLVGVTDIYSRLADSLALVGYQNSQHRLNWGGVAMRIPYVYGSYGVAQGEIYNRPALIEYEDIFRQIDYQFSGFAFYPFNQLQRFEVSAGFRLIDFQEVLYSYYYDPYTYELLLYDKQNLPSPASLKFATASAALVYDSSFFGATSPLIGQSYRFEAAPYVGSINFYTILADYRRYFMPIRPFTLAFRLLHYGRYGKGGEDNRLYPLYLGYDYFIRGYDYNSFDYNENFDYGRLWGSRMMVANAELRFPLFNVLGIGRGFYGILPIEFFLFYDAGIAWWNDDKVYDPTTGLLSVENRKASFLGGGRKPVTSAGIGLRMNVLGYLVLGVNYVKPFDRPNKNWRFQISVIPGF